MIEKILKMRKNSNTSIELKALEEELENLNQARYYFLASYYVPGLDIAKISSLILATNNSRYISFYFRQIDGINLGIFFTKILNFNDPKLIFYALYDKRNLDDSFFIQGIKKLLTLPNNKHYLGLTFYYYFNILQRYNDEIFYLLTMILSNVNKDNYRIILESYYQVSKNKVTKHLEECPNKFIGHNNIIPDMIVCHQSFDYGRIINIAYDEKTDVSCHFAVSRTGKYHQCISLDNSSWANGTSFNDTSDVYNAFAKSNLVKSRNINANYYTFSIEHEAMDGSLTTEQYQTSLKIMCQIIDYLKNKYNYDFPIDKDHIVGHQDINPIVRVSCPGPKFPTEQFIADLHKIYQR